VQINAEVRQKTKGNSA